MQNPGYGASKQLVLRSAVLFYEINGRNTTKLSNSFASFHESGKLNLQGIVTRYGLDCPGIES
jgi:hypothetical protein